jgi:hypothetical protein
MKTGLWIAGAGVVLIGGGWYLLNQQKTALKASTTVASLQPVGVPYQRPDLGPSSTQLFQKVALNMSDHNMFVYIFPVEALASVAQLQGQSEAQAAQLVPSLGGVPADTKVTLTSGLVSCAGMTCMGLQRHCG